MTKRKFSAGLLMFGRRGGQVSARRIHSSRSNQATEWESSYCLGIRRRLLARGDTKQHVFDGMPPKSGVQKEFPEVDRADWFTLDHARSRTVKGQIGFLDRLWPASVDFGSAYRPPSRTQTRASKFSTSPAVSAPR